MRIGPRLQAAVAGAAMLAAPAGAAPLGAVGAGSATADYNAGFDAAASFTLFGANGVAGANGQSGGSILASPAPSIALQAVQNSGGLGAGNFGGTLQLTYQFQVDGPQAAVGVHVAALGSFAVSAPGSYRATAMIGLVVNDPLSDELILSDTAQAFIGLATPTAGGAGTTESLSLLHAAGNATDGFTGGFGEDADYQFRTGIAYRVYLSIGGGVSGDMGRFEALVDPVFTLAAGTVDPELYTLSVSSNVFNETVDAPEPASAALVLSACGAVAWRRRRPVRA